MQKSKIEYLIEKYHQDNLLPAEKSELIELLALEENESIAEEFFLKAWEKSRLREPLFSEGRSKELLHRVLGTTKAGDNSHSDYRSLFSIKRLAIAASLLIGIGTGIFYYKTAEVSPNLAQETHKEFNIPPGGNKAVLTLADNTEINLDSIADGATIRFDNMVVKKTQDGQLSYEISNDVAKEAATGINTIRTPRGGQYMVILADGTKVWLNSASVLSFPVAFDSGDRVVELSGEGYFEVAKDAGRRFRVKADEAEIEVLGTKFNVNAYQNETATGTPLLEGSVKKSNKENSILIKPGQQARVVKGRKEISTSAVDTDEIIAWKEGYFQFTNTDIHAVMRELSRWYDVDIEFEDPTIGETFAGRISRKKDISEVLKVFEATGTIRFKLIHGDAAGKGRRIIVMK